MLAAEALVMTRISDGFENGAGGNRTRPTCGSGERRVLRGRSSTAPNQCSERGPGRMFEQVPLRSIPFITELFQLLDAFVD